MTADRLHTPRLTLLEPESTEDEMVELFDEGAQHAYQIGLHVGAEHKRNAQWWAGFSVGLLLGMLSTFVLALTLGGRL